MVHAIGDPGWVAWTNGVDASIAGRTTPADVDTKIATQAATDSSTYVPKTGATTSSPAVDVPVLRVASDTHPDAAFRIDVSPGATFTGQSQTFNDPQVNIGFFNEGSSPSHGIIMEQDYWFDSGAGVFKHKAEFHNVFITASGQQYRPITWTGQYDNGFIDVTINSDKFTIQSALGVPKIAVLSTGEVVFGPETATPRVGPTGLASAFVFIGGGITYDSVDARYEATSFNPAAVVVGEGAIDFYAAIAQTVGVQQTRKGGITQAGNFDVTGDVKAGGMLVFGSNSLQIAQNGYSIQFNANFLLGAGLVSGFGAPVNGTITLNLKPVADASKGMMISPFSAAQTADLLSSTNSGGVGKFAVLAGGTPLSEDAAGGYVFKDAAATPHYWRATVSTAGVLTTTDLGTVRPTA